MAEKKTAGEAAPHAPVGGPAPGEQITKNEAVRRALAALGNDAKPLAMQPWIKEHLGIDMGTDHISTAKGEILHQHSKKSKKKSATKRAKSKATAPVAPALADKPAKVAPAPEAVKAPPAANGKGGIQLEDILALKTLVERVGPDQLHTLIDVLSR